MAYNNSALSRCRTKDERQQAYVAGRPLMYHICSEKGFLEYALASQQHCFSRKIEQTKLAEAHLHHSAEATERCTEEADGCAEKIQAWFHSTGNDHTSYYEA